MMRERIKDIVCVYIFVSFCINQCSCISLALKQQQGCQKDQVERIYRGRNFCCYPLKCKPGQKFDFCRTNNGHDTCQNCPDGFSHKDLIDTATWFDFIVDPCVPVEDCSDYSDLIRENEECVCDRTRGYYGRDRHNCAADLICKKAGFEMDQDGLCLMCGEEHFKTKEDYSLCIMKTRCTRGQEVDFKGSHTADRTCRRRIVQKPEIPAPVKPTTKEANITKFDKGDVDRSRGMEEKNTTVDVPDLDRTIKKIYKHNNSGNSTLLVVLVVVIAILIGTIAFIYCRRKTGQQWNDWSCINLTCCPQNSVNHNNVYNKKDITVNNSNNVVVGDYGKIVADEDSNPGEDTPMKEVELD